MRDKIKSLINSDLSGYEISRLSNQKIPANTIYKLRKNQYNIDNLSFKVVEEMIRINDKYVKWRFKRFLLIW